MQNHWFKPWSTCTCTCSSPLHCYFSLLIKRKNFFHGYISECRNLNQIWNNDTAHTLCVRYSSYGLAVVSKCYRAVALWNVTSLHLGKLVIRGYKLVVMAIVVNSKNDLWTAWVLLNWKIAVWFAMKEHWCWSPLKMRTCKRTIIQYVWSLLWY